MRAGAEAKKLYTVFLYTVRAKKLYTVESR